MSKRLKPPQNVQNKMEYSRFPNGRSQSHSLVIVRGMPDYVDIAVSQTEPQEKKRRSQVFHPVVVVGLITTIVYGLFITLLLAYMNFQEFRDFVHSLKRLANIKEWFRIIFKPWQSEGSNRFIYKPKDANHDHDQDHDARETDLDPEMDVRIVG